MKSGLPVAVILPAPVDKVGCVEVRRVEINGGAGGTPDIDHPRLRAATWKTARLRVVLGEPCVHIHRNVVGRLSGCSDGMNEPRIVPRHEYLVGAIGVAEDFGPGAGGLIAVLIPQLAQARIERVVVGFEVARQFGGNRRVECAVGFGGAIA